MAGGSGTEDAHKCSANWGISEESLMRPRPRIASRRLDTLRDFDGKLRDTGVVDFPYRSDGLVFLRFFRRGGQTGASGFSLPLTLFLLASRWTYVTEPRCKLGFPERSIWDTDFLSVLNPRPLYRVIPKNSIIYVTVSDPDILQGF